ncbi:DUF6126 family protein [Streptomyces mayteni]
MADARDASKGSGRDRIPRGLWIRLLVYGLVGHAFAGFLIFLFSLGANR